MIDLCIRYSCSLCVEIIKNSVEGYLCKYAVEYYHIIVNNKCKSNREDQDKTLHRRVVYGPQREKTCLRGFANNTGADQPARPRSLICALLIRFSESIIYKIATGEISI